MLLEFGVKNYRSFRDEARLTMLPVNAYKEKPENLAPVKPLGTNSDGVLSAAVIYGANASGKTNLLKAIDFGRACAMGLITFGSPDYRSAFVGCEAPSEFSFSIIANGTRYRYEFSLSDEGATDEALYVRPRGERLVYRRTRQEDGSYAVKQGSMYSGIESKLKGFSDNGLVLNFLAKFGMPDCAAVVRWFVSTLSVHDKSDPLEQGEILQKLINLGESSFTKVIDAVKSADLGIVGAQISVSDLTAEERESQKVATDKIKAVFAALVGESSLELEPPDQKTVFQFQHTINGNRVGFGFDRESLGTVTLLNLAADFVDAIVNGRVLVVDEIERSLHPMLLKSLVSLFFDRDLNTKNAQLVFTTHDLSIMSSDLLRRDQIWFVQKDPVTGGSELYSLAEYSPRKDDNILNRYLSGAYGAVPFIERVL